MLLKILKETDKEKVKQYIDKLPEGKQYIVEIKQKRSIRSIQQNRLYWLWIACICDETGGDKDSVHSELGEMFLPKEQRKGIIEIREIPVSTSSLNTLQFTNYLESINVFASSELGIVLPNPDDLYWDEFYSKYKDFI